MLPPHSLGTLREPWVALGVLGEEVMEEAMAAGTVALVAGPMELETTMATVESEETTMTPERAKGL